MTKQGLIDYVAKNADMSKAEAGRALDAVLDGITAGLKKEKEVVLVGFGIRLEVNDITAVFLLRKDFGNR